MAYPNINGDAELIKRKTKDDHLRELHYKTEKHDNEIILKVLRLIMKNIRRNIKV